MWGQIGYRILLIWADYGCYCVKPTFGLLSDQMRFVSVKSYRMQIRLRVSSDWVEVQILDPHVKSNFGSTYIESVLVDFEIPFPQTYSMRMSIDFGRFCRPS